MPAPWSPSDSVQVRVGAPGASVIWVDATVDEVVSNGVYRCTITTSPLPTLADCGRTHPLVDDTKQIKASCIARSASNNTAAEDTIRDPV